jgi:hypothetical protein
MHLCLIPHSKNMVFMQRKYEMKLLLSAGLFAAVATSAFADAILGTPNEVIIGINDAGHLNIPYRTSKSLPQLLAIDPAGVGFIGLRTWDALLTGVEQGCLCEGWGVAARSSSGDFLDACGVDADDGEDQVVVDSTLNKEPGSFTSVVTCGFSQLLKVTHKYTRSFRSKSMIRVDVTIENNACDKIDDIMYRRVADWDVDPTPLFELVTIKGTGGRLYEGSNNNGFCSPNPSVPCDPLDPSTSNVDFTDLGPTDHGMHVQLKLGSLSPSSKVTFTTWYGVAQSETAAVKAVRAVGANFWSFGQSAANGKPATFIYAVKDRASKKKMRSKCSAKLARAPELAAFTAVNETDTIAEKQSKNSAAAK